MSVSEEGSRHSKGPLGDLLLVNPVDDQIDDIPHDDSRCPHIAPKRYCGDRLSRVQFCTILILSVCIAVGLLIFGIIYALGRS